MTHLRRIEEAEALGRRRRTSNRLPERAYDAAFTVRIRRSSYRRLVKDTQDEEISDLTASRD
jgi:hypothetical protein